MLAEKIVEDAHIRTLHGGVSLTMAEVRREYWIPRLRPLTKKVRKASYGCKRFQVTTETGENSASLNVNATELIPERMAAVAAQLQIRDAAEYERELPTVKSYLLPLGTK